MSVWTISKASVALFAESFGTGSFFELFNFIFFLRDLLDCKCPQETYGPNQGPSLGPNYNVPNAYATN